MNGFVNTVKGFSQVAIDALVTQADDMYILEGIPPSAITDFNATDATIGKVTCTWSPAVGATSYSLYTGTTELATGVTSPYNDTYTGTRDYHVKAINVNGSTDSNIDSGTGVETPGDGEVIVGLTEGTNSDNAAATSNSTLLEGLFLGDEVKNYIIPAGTYFVDLSVGIGGNTTLTWEEGASITQIYPSTDQDSNYAPMAVKGANVTLNQPHISQGGYVRSSDLENLSGTHATLTCYYNSPNFTVNGGILELGGSNAFQGGRNNTVFNGTTFRDCREHLVYCSGLNGDFDNGGYAKGITFNDCIFENPGIGDDPWESNHIQLRSYINVAFNRCTVSGEVENGHQQMAILMTDIDGFHATDCTFNDYNNSFIWIGTEDGHDGSKDINFTRCNATPKTNWDYPISFTNNLLEGAVNFTDCNFYKTRGIKGDAVFTGCLINADHQSFDFMSNRHYIFDTCTWDFSNYGGANAIVVSSGATYEFIGTQTKIDDGSINWYPVP